MGEFTHFSQPMPPLRCLLYSISVNGVNFSGCRFHAGSAVIMRMVPALSARAAAQAVP
jgi:hypothetical protein